MTFNAVRRHIVYVYQSAGAPGIPLPAVGTRTALRSSVKQTHWSIRLCSLSTSASDFSVDTQTHTVVVSKRSSSWIRESWHWLVRCQDLRQRRSSENKTTQGVNPCTQGGQLYEQRCGGLPTTFQRPMTVFWSRAHRQRHVTICLMKFVGERNVAIRYIYFVLGCVIWIWLSHTQLLSCAFASQSFNVNIVNWVKSALIILQLGLSTAHNDDVAHCLSSVTYEHTPTPLWICEVPCDIFNVMCHYN